MSPAYVLEDWIGCLLSAELQHMHVKFEDGVNGTYISMEKGQAMTCSLYNFIIKCKHAGGLDLING